MNRQVFPPELRTMAIVPRWNIVATTLKDDVATHSYFVTVYSYLIAEIIHWDGPRDYLMLHALMHDNDETITSDITGPIKKSIITTDVQEMLDTFTEQRMEGLIDVYYTREDRCTPREIEGVDLIVSAADKLDALLFLIMNRRMGNTIVEPAIKGNQLGLEAAWRALPAAKEVLDQTWNTVMLPAIKDHYERGARGFHPGANL